MNDEILGRVVDRLEELGWSGSTDIVITQDHNHSTVSADVSRFPFRRLVDGGVGPIDPHGFSVSGFVRTAELLTLDGLKAYDGAGCRNVPTLSGILKDGTELHPTRVDEKGEVCGRKQQYTSSRYPVPKPLPAGAIVVAANAGSDYLFIPDGDPKTVRAAVTSLQSRPQFGAIFVSDRYGRLPGTLPLSLIKADSPIPGRGPDIIVSFTFDEKVAVAGHAGISYASSINRRGDHGSFSPADVHISLMLHGPDFKAGLRDTLPTANVDIAPTIARVLGFDLPGAEGRVLEEALKDGPPLTQYSVKVRTYQSPKRAGLRIKLPTDVDGRSFDPLLTSYVVKLKTKKLSRDGASWVYFDEARAFRE
jgi:arylsulfatase A-like enzyme